MGDHGYEREGCSERMVERVSVWLDVLRPRVAGGADAGGSGREVDGAGLGEGRSDSREDLRILDDVRRLVVEKREKLRAWRLLKRSLMLKSCGIEAKICITHEDLPCTRGGRRSSRSPKGD